MLQRLAQPVPDGLHLSTSPKAPPVPSIAAARAASMLRAKLSRHLRRLIAPTTGADIPAPR
jgi:hypothetical protein